MMLGTPLGEVVRDALLSDSPEMHTSEVNLAEAGYVLCRKLGEDKAASKLDKLRNSNYILIADMEAVSRLAAKIKCTHSVSLVDCFTLATAKITGSKALFVRREADLEREMKKRPFEVELIFLEEMNKRNRSEKRLS